MRQNILSFKLIQRKVRISEITLLYKISYKDFWAPETMSQSFCGAKSALILNFAGQ